jgi:chaperonin GroES
MNLEALHNHVIIKQSELEEKTYGSILIADTGKEKPMIGEVLAVGPGIMGFIGWMKPSTEIGDIVLVPSFGGMRIMYEGEEYLVYKDIDILAKINLKDE